VTFEAAQSLPPTLAFGLLAREVGAGVGVPAPLVDGEAVGGAVSWRLSRWRRCSPLDAKSGAAPACIASPASLAKALGAGGLRRLAWSRSACRSRPARAARRFVLTRSPGATTCASTRLPSQLA
jgi:hypothetical protein